MLEVMDFSFGDPEPTTGENVAEEIPVENIGNKVEALEKEAEELDTKHSSLEAEIATLESLIKQAREERNKIREERKVLTPLIKEATAELETAKREAAKKAYEEELETKQAEKQDEFTRLSKGKAWYEGVQVGDRVLKAYDHQIEGAKFIATAKRAILGDEMGTGKTITSLINLDFVEAKKVIAIVPADLVSVYAEEARQWAPHRKVVGLDGKTGKERDLILEFIKPFDNYIIVLNFETWYQDRGIITALRNLKADTVIVDEAHVAKDTRSMTYRGIKSLVDESNVCPICPDAPVLMPTEERNAEGFEKPRQCGKCWWSGQTFTAYDNNGKELGVFERRQMSRSVKNFLAMTGTVILNSPKDIYPLLYLVAPEMFPTERIFLQTYCLQDIFTGAWGFAPGGVESLTKRIAPFYIARTTEEVGIVLPEQRVEDHILDITPEQYPDQYRVIQELTKHAQTVIGDDIGSLTPLNQISLITYKRLANVWPGGIKIRDEEGNVVFEVSENIKESIKIDAAVNMIQEWVAEGRRVALFSQFSSALQEIDRRLKEIGVRSVRFDGSTKPSVRKEVKSNFNRSRGEAPKWDVVLANYKTGGVGLTLTNATRTIILDEEWNPGKRNQAYKRTHRIGQTEETEVRILYVNRTIDTWMRELIRSKEQLIEGFDEGMLTAAEALQTAIFAEDQI